MIYIYVYVCVCACVCEIGLSLQYRAHVANLIFQKLPDVTVFNDLYVKPSSRYSLVRMLPTSSSKGFPNVADFTILV